LAFRHGFKAEANRIAVRIREQMGFDSIAPIDPLEICKRFNIDVILLSDLDNTSPFLKQDKSAFSALTVPCGLTMAIVHNDSHHPYPEFPTPIQKQREPLFWTCLRSK
jgi:hypothetical protein